MKLYATINKTEEQSDGTIKVWGIASSEAVDSDGEVISSEAMKAALPDYMKFGAVREMHQPSAAGTAIEASVEADGSTFFGAHIVDPIAVKKVQTGVYKGFSIGGKVTSRDPMNKANITGLKLVEVSLVDRPANPEAIFTCYKAEGIDEVDEVIEVNEPLKKGMWTLQDFASVIQQVAYIAEDSACEADWEGDNSGVPAQLLDWLKQGVAIFHAMASEETTEMLNRLTPQASVIQLSEKAVTFLNDNVDVLSKMLAEKPAIEEIPASVILTGEVQKSVIITGEAQKAEGEDLSKAMDILKDDLSKAIKDNEVLKAQLDELKKKAAPPKGVLNTVAVDKSTDSVTDTSLIDKANADIPAEGTPERAKYELKKVFQSGGKRLA